MRWLPTVNRGSLPFAGDGEFMARTLSTMQHMWRASHPLMLRQRQKILLQSWLWQVSVVSAWKSSGQCILVLHMWLNSQYCWNVKAEFGYFSKPVNSLLGDWIISFSIPCFRLTQPLSLGCFGHNAPKACQGKLLT